MSIFSLVFCLCKVILFFRVCFTTKIKKTIFLCSNFFVPIGNLNWMLNSISEYRSLVYRLRYIFFMAINVQNLFLRKTNIISTKWNLVRWVTWISMVFFFITYKIVESRKFNENWFYRGKWKTWKRIDKF